MSLCTGCDFFKTASENEQKNAWETWQIKADAVHKNVSDLISDALFFFNLMRLRGPHAKPLY